MIAVAILIVAAILGWLWTRVVNRMSYEACMTLGVLMLVPPALILIGTVVALVVLT